MSSRSLASVTDQRSGRTWVVIGRRLRILVRYNGSAAGWGRSAVADHRRISDLEYCLD